MTKLSFIPLSLVVLGGCSLLDAATAEKPSSTQLQGMGDGFAAAATFGQMVDDPAAVSQGDLVDMHAKEPFQKVVDPDGTVNTARKRLDEQALDACVTRDEAAGTASWDCDASFEGHTCTAVGTGQKAGNSYSGMSTLVCDDTALNVRLVATNVFYDETAGSGGGVITVTVGPGFTGWATMRIRDITLCTEESTPKPNGGTVEVDGEGPLNGAPFDPLTVRFQDDPVCGTALIEE